MNRPILPAAAIVFAAVGLLALGYYAAVFIGARLYQTREARSFVPEKHAESPATLRRANPVTGSAVAMLEIPRLGMSMVVLEGAEERQLKLGPGHIRGTPMPGTGGNVGVAGHRDTFFRPLRFTRKKDTIKMITHGQEYRYTVVSLEIVEPSNIEALRPTGHETLTLVTCYPFDFVGPAPKRFIVRADCEDCER
jgi:sortase A